MCASRIRHTRRLPAVAVPTAAAGTVRVADVLAYGPEGYLEEGVSSVERLAELRAAYPVVWADVAGHGDVALLEAIRATLGLHPLAVEDVVNLGQRPKVEEYDENLFTVVREVRFDDRVLTTEQISLFLASGLVVTFQEHAGDCFEQLRDKIRTGRGKVRKCEADYLYYSLIDAIVDGYFPVIEAIGDRVEGLEETVLLEAQDDAIGPIHTARRELLVLRKAIVPLRDSLERVQSEELEFITEHTRVYFRDVVDHLNRAHDLVEAYRDLCHSVMEAHLSVLSARLNDVMSLLTVISTIFIPLSFLAGIWGMNFDPTRSHWNMPELEWAYGYPAALGVMGFVGFGQLWFYHRRGWIRIRRRRSVLGR